jgi:TRAP-type C4-dicarboxylate transport system permease small subunit
MLNEAGTKAGYQTGDNVAETGLATIVGNVVRIFLSLLGVIFICYTIYGGFLWMTAAGNDDKVTQGRNTIRDGIIGIVVTLGALAIYLFIRAALITAA